MGAEDGMIRRISVEVSEEILKTDLERYKQKTLELGAAQAEVIPAQWAQLDEWVRFKCYVPRCYNYGQCAYCPPYTSEPELTSRALSRFNWAVLFRIDVTPVEDFTDINLYFPHETN